MASMQQVTCDLLLVRQVQEEIIIPRSLRLRALSRVLLAAAPTFWMGVQPQVLEAFCLHYDEVTKVPQKWRVSSCHSPAQSVFLSKIGNQRLMLVRLRARTSMEVDFLCYIISFCVPYRRIQSIPTLDKVGLLKFLLTFMINFLLVLMGCGSSMGGTGIQNQE